MAERPADEPPPDPPAENSPVELPGSRSRAGGCGWWGAPRATALLGARPAADIDLVARRRRGAGRPLARPGRPPGGVLRAVLRSPLLAGRQHRARHGRPTSSRCGRRRSSRTWGCATSPSTRSPSRSPAATPIDPLGGIATFRARRLRAASADAFLEDPLRVMRLARVAVELDLSRTRRRSRWPGRPRRCSPGCRPSGCSPSCAGSSPPSRPAAASNCSRTSARPPSCCPSWRRCGECSRAATTTPTCTCTRSRCSSERSPSRTRWRGEPRRVGGRCGTRWRAWTPSCATAWQRSWPSRSPTSSRAARRWRGGRCSTTPPSPSHVGPAADGRVTFIGHDVAARSSPARSSGRLRASERLQAFVAALVRNHLRLGFLVHEPQPLSRRTLFGYLRACSPVEVDVTLLSIADRLATRGDRAAEAIAAHLQLAIAILPDALRWRAQGPPAVPLRGDELARELGSPRAPSRRAARGAARGALRGGHHHPRRGGSVRPRAARRAAGPRRPDARP